MRVSKSLPLLLILFISGLGFSQSITLSSSPDSDPLVPCDFHVHSVDIAISPSASAGDQVYIDFPSLPSELSILNPTVPSGTTGVGAVTYSGGQVTVNIVSAVSLFTLEFEVWGNCSLFNYSNGFIDFDVEATLGTSSDLISVTHSVNTAEFNMQPVSTFVQNFGDIENHVFEYKNTGPVDFNGTVKFSYQLVDPSSFLSLGTPYHATSTPVGFVNPAVVGVPGAITSSVSLAEVEVDFTSTPVPPNGSIYFVVPATLIGCVSDPTDPKGRSTAIIEYGCDLLDLCTDNSSDLGNVTSTILGPGPAWELTRIDDNFICPVGTPATDYHEYIATNTGLGNADTIEVQIRNRGSNSISYLLDPSNVTFTHIRSGTVLSVQTPSPAHISANVSIYTGQPTAYTYTVLPLAPENHFEPGDEIKITYDVEHSCPDPVDYASYFAQGEVIANDVILGGRFMSNCFRTANHPNDWTWYNYPALACPKPIPGGTQANNNQVGNRFDVNQTWFDPTGPVAGASCGSNLGTNEQRQYAIASGLNIDCMAGGSPLLFVDPEDLIIRVDLEIGCGLDLVTGSTVQFQTNDPTSTVQTISGTIVSTSTTPLNVENYEVHFTVPASFWQLASTTPNSPCTTSFGIHEWTSEFSDFFANFDVLLTVEPDCCEANSCDISSGIPVVQSFFINHPGDGQQNCGGTCWLPLSQETNNIDITCPGCFVPGWNVISMSMERVNLDAADDNDDNIPDNGLNATGPANPSLANTDRVINGDIVKITLDAFLSDGEISANCDLSMNSGIWGAALQFSQLHLKGDLLKDMTFLGATGNFNGVTLDIDALPGTNSFDNYSGGNDFWLQLHATNMQNYLTTGSFTGYYPQNNDAIQLELYFQINTDITSTSFSPEGVYSAMYLSKVDCTPANQLWATPGTCKVDALTQTCADIANMTSAQLDDLMLWCVASESSIMNVGFFEHAFSNATNALGTNSCLKTIEIRAHEFTGNDILIPQWNNPIDQSIQTQMKCFQFEARRIADLNKVEFPDVTGYELDEVRFYMKNLKANGSLTQMSCIPFGFPNTPYTILSGGGFPITGGMYQVDVTSHYKTSILPVVCNGVQTGVNIYDETKVYRIVGVYKMENCSTTPASVDVSNQDVVLHWDNYPAAPLNSGSGGPCDQNDQTGCPQLGSATENVTIGINSDTWYKPNNPITLNALNLSNTMAGCDINFDLDLIISGLLGTNQGNQHGYENFFLHFESSCGNITINSIDPTDPNWNVIPTLNPVTGLWELGHVGIQGLSNYMGIMNVCADYDCSGCNGVDNTITIKYGWDCGGYPSIYPDPGICFEDQITLVIPATDAALQGTILTPDLTWEPCGSQTVDLELTSTGLDEVVNVVVTPVVPAGLTLTGTTTPTFPSPFNSFANVVYSYDFDVACDYDGTPVSFDIDYEDFCGNQTNITSVHPAISIVPVTASLTTSINTCDVTFSGSLSGLCSPTSWSWNYGDGNSDTGQNPPAHSYAVSGTYPVTLTVQYTDGTSTCSVTHTENVTVTCIDPCSVQNIFPGFDVTANECIVNIADVSVVSPNWTITNWSWNFGNGQTYVGPNPPSVNYTLPGVYTICLTVTATTTINNQLVECTETLCQDVTVDCDPCNYDDLDALFSFQTGLCEVIFTDESTVSAGWNITGWFWNFGDGNTSTLQNPTHSYANAGSYTVCLTITAETIINGVVVECQKTYCISILVDCDPCIINQTVTNFSFVEDGCIFYFSDLSIPGAGGTIIEWNWTFGDGTTSTLQNPNHTFAANGTYTVCLTTITEYIVNNMEVFCPHTYCFTITVDCLPECDVSAYFEYEKHKCKVDFIDLSQAFGSTSMTWDWDFGDGTLSTQQNPSHTYNTSGTYVVCLTVTAYSGTAICGQATYCTTVVINCPSDEEPCFINADFSTSVQPGLTANFTDISSGSGTVYQWLWDFGDGNTSTLQNPTHVYASSGIYPVCLTVWATAGNTSCSDEECKEVKVKYVLFKSAEAPVISPNPTTGKIDIELPSGVIYEISVLTLKGEVLLTELGRQNKTLDLTPFEQGVYLIKVSCQDGTWTERIVKI